MTTETESAGSAAQKTVSEEIRLVSMFDVKDDGEFVDRVRVAVYGREPGMRAIYTGSAYHYPEGTSFECWERKIAVTDERPGYGVEWSRADTSVRAPGAACLARVRREVESLGRHDGAVALERAVDLAHAQYEAEKTWAELRTRYLATLDPERLAGWGGLVGMAGWLEQRSDETHARWMRLRYLLQAHRTLLQRRPVSLREF